MFKYHVRQTLALRFMTNKYLAQIFIVNRTRTSSLLLRMQDPVDLTLITSRLRRQDHYLNLDIFVADFKRMFRNCKCVVLFISYRALLQAYAHPHLSTLFVCNIHPRRAALDSCLPQTHFSFRPRSIPILYRGH